jgi:beta-glucanase (GH16 family)
MRSNLSFSRLSRLACRIVLGMLVALPSWAGTTFTGNYYLVSLYSGKALDVADASGNSGANVQQWSYGAGGNQQWELSSAGGGAYFLKNRQSGLYLDIAWGATNDGANVQQAAYNGSNAQKFGVVEMEKGIYRLQNLGSGKVVDVAGVSQANGANVHQWTWVNGNNQKWKIIPVGAATNLAGTIRIDSVHSGLSLDVDGISTAPAANVLQWNYVGGANQQWNLINTNNGYYKIQAKHSGHMLDIANASTANSANLQQYPDNGSDAQLFAIINAGNNEYQIRNKNSGKALDVEDWAAYNGGNILQYQYHAQANQKWRLTALNGSTDGNGTACGTTPVWSDEFNYNGLPDPGKWGFEVQRPGWVNNEWQNYTGNRQENARVGNGVLTIEARKDWFGGHEISSARLKTQYKGDWLNGRIEVRAKLPRGRGTWPAIWMMPSDSAYGGWPNSGEIDIMENVGYDPAAIHGSIHTNGRNFMLRNNFQATTYDGSVMDSFHTYAIDWNQNRIVFYKDGQAFGTFGNAGQGWTTWPFDKRFYLILNLAIGGDWGGAQGVDMNIFPAQMQVDWVRVYKSCN